MDNENFGRKDICNKHLFIPLGFETISKEKEIVESIAAITCQNCGMFRTKILVFHRQLSQGSS